jgi:hypothetical protein
MRTDTVTQILLLLFVCYARSLLYYPSAPEDLAGGGGGKKAQEAFTEKHRHIKNNK